VQKILMNISVNDKRGREKNCCIFCLCIYLWVCKQFGNNTLIIVNIFTRLCGSRQMASSRSFFWLIFVFPNILDIFLLDSESTFFPSFLIQLVYSLSHSPCIGILVHVLFLSYIW